MLHIPYNSKLGLVEDIDVPPPSMSSVEFFHEMLVHDKGYVDETITYIHPRIPTSGELIECAREVYIDAKIDELTRTYMARKTQAKATVNQKTPKPAPVDIGVGKVLVSEDVVKKVLPEMEEFPVFQDELTGESAEYDGDDETSEVGSDVDGSVNDPDILALELELQEAINMPSEERKVKARALQALRQRRWKEKNGRYKTGKPNTGTYIVDDMDVLHVVIRTSVNSNLYTQGADVGPKYTLTETPFGNSSKMNVYERLMSLQRQLDAKNATPKWIVFTRDDVSILDPYFKDRLLSVQVKNTVCLGAFGTKEMRVSGRWWDNVDRNEIVGQYIQGAAMDPFTMDHIIAPNYNDPKYVKGFGAVCITTGMLAVRGSFFRSIDFESMAARSAVGYFHFIPMMCMVAARENKTVAVLRTLIRQENAISAHVNEESTSIDHKAFIREYFPILPLSIKH